MNSYSCSICGSETIKVARAFTLTQNSKFSWEHDSTMKLLDWPEVEVQRRFCPGCFHSIIFPKFDAAKLYGERGSNIRRDVFETYFPDKVYGNSETSDIKFNVQFSGMANEFQRFHQVSSFIGQMGSLKTLIENGSEFKEKKKLRILDWGGGDGYVSSVYAIVLQVVAKVEVESYIYDHTKWSNIKPKRVGLDELKNMDPFHIIVFSHILEHTHDPITEINLAKQFLIENGMVITEVPDERSHSIRTSLLAVIFRKQYGLHYHVHQFTRRSLHTLFIRAGFRNVSTAYFINSSYRGNRIACILGIAQLGESITTRLPNRLYETFSAMWIILKWVFSGKPFQYLSRIFKQKMRIGS